MSSLDPTCFTLFALPLFSTFCIFYSFNWTLSFWFLSESRSLPCRNQPTCAQRRTNQARFTCTKVSTPLRSGWRLSAPRTPLLVRRESTIPLEFNFSSKWRIESGLAKSYPGVNYSTGTWKLKRVSGLESRAFPKLLKFTNYHTQKCFRDSKK